MKVEGKEEKRKKLIDKLIIVLLCVLCFIGGYMYAPCLTDLDGLCVVPCPNYNMSNLSIMLMAQE